ncbi:MAG: nucleotide exchange factor GrpE [Candidatus Omnitrophica bacterium]|nr:nucleotide exchange factor GrpE [Candidatus Omnitrophota bacterium]
MDKNIKKDFNSIKGEEDTVEQHADDTKAAASQGMIEVDLAEYNKLKEAVTGFKEYKEKYIRLYAEFDNARKRMERDKMEFLKYANEEIILQFLDVLDDFERSVSAAEKKHEDYDAFLKGIEMVMAQIYEMLKRNGVSPLDIQGQKFDPTYHEVLLQEETADVEEGTIIQEFQKGYAYNDRVIRTAKVKLAKAPSE